MQRGLLLILAFIITSCANKLPQHNIHIIPEPQEIHLRTSVLDVQGASFWVDGNIDFTTFNVIDGFRKQLALVSASDCKLSNSRKGAIFRFSLNQKLGPEEYILDINKQKLRVEASSFNGFLYAIETIKQVLPVQIYADTPYENASWILPGLKIQDSPRFAYRGMHLDVARHFWDLGQIKKYLGIMAVHKMNVFHMHLTDDQGWRIEIKKYPKLTEIGSKRKGTAIGRGWYDVEYDGLPYGGYYTQDEIREIVSYAASKGIEVIPEIDIPAHMLAAIASYPELCCTGQQYEVWGRWGVSPEVLCAGKESSFEFLENVFLEIIDLFPSKYIHIGGDECPKIRWETCPACQARMKELGLTGDKATTLLQGYVTNRLEAFLNKHGKIIIGWDEILDGAISSSATIMSWRGLDGGVAASASGHDVIMTPNTYCYFDYYQSRKIQEEPFAIGGFVNVEKTYSFEPFTDSMTAKQKRHILGVQGNLWTEYIKTPEHLEYMLLPRLSALSEVQWCTTDKKDYQRFLDKMSHMVEIYKILDFNYAKHIFEVQPIIEIDEEKGLPRVILSSQGDAPMYYTLDGSQPTTASTLYIAPVIVNDGEIFKAIVDREGMETRTYAQTFIKHKAMGKPITMNTNPSSLHAKGLPYSLVNGVLNESQATASDEWMAWRGEPVDLEIDMKGDAYSKVSVRALVSKWEDMYAPLELIAYASKDGKAYEKLAFKAYPIEEETVPDGIKLYEISFPETSLRCLKVIVKTLPALPEWSERHGRPAYLFIDEIRVD